MLESAYQPLSESETARIAQMVSGLSRLFVDRLTKRDPRAARKLAALERAARHALAESEMSREMGVESDNRRRFAAQMAYQNLYSLVRQKARFSMSGHESYIPKYRQMILDGRFDSAAGVAFWAEALATETYATTGCFVIAMYAGSKNSGSPLKHDVLLATLLAAVELLQEA